MRDYSTIGKRRRAGKMGRCGTIGSQLLPTPPGPQEHAANVEFMAKCLFGAPAEALGVQGLIAEVSLDDV